MICYSLIPVFLFMLTDVQGLNESCNKNSNCDTKNAICIDGKCNCDDISYYNDTMCLPYATEYNALCYESAQCEKWLGDNADCKNNRCVCKSQFRWYKGKCQAYVDKEEACTSDDGCYNGYDLLSLSCIFDVCRCSADYYDRGYDCRHRSGWLGDCALESDCISIFNTNLVCTLGKCELVLSNSAKSEEMKNKKLNETNMIVSTETQDADYIEKMKSKKLDATNLIVPTDIQDNISCEKDDDCRDMANSVCDITKATCGCVEQTHYLYNGNCVPGLNKCDAVEDCGNNTMCFNNKTCVCQRGFFMRDKKCIAELGMEDPNVNYESDNDCPIKPGKLSRSACFCKNYWFNDDANRNCIKTTLESTQSCLTNEWCDIMGPYSFCNSTTSKCGCSSFAKLNSATHYCEKIEEPTSDLCLRDNECAINEYCVDEKCECIENFSRHNNVCLPNVEASCEFASCSHIGNSSCTGKACKCNNNFIGKIDRCLILADDLQDSCEEQEQCQNLEHAVCGAAGEEHSSVCTCAEEYTAINSTCYQTKKYGDPCTTESECTRVLNHSYKCRNSICQCAIGLELKNGYCTSSANVVFGSYALLLITVMKLGIF